MALIKCPQCGQTVLSVASVCPKCSYILLQKPTPQGEDRDFVTCRRCGKVIARAAVHCEYCNYPQRTRRLLRRGAIAVLTLAIIVLATLYLRGRFSADGSPADTTRQPVTVPPVMAAAPDSEPSRPEPPQTESIADVAPDVEPAVPEPAPPALPPSPRTLTRWTITWTNVREGRGIEYPVVRVLSPGDSVQVANYSLGWWRVYAGGQAVGFVATDLLVDQPPSR